MEVETRRTIEKARFIARVAGVENQQVERAERCACQIGKSTSVNVFQTPAVTIVAGNDTLELSITKRENDNPVIVANSKGEVFRSHGEFFHVWDEINEIFDLL